MKRSHILAGFVALAAVHCGGPAAPPNDGSTVTTTKPTGAVPVTTAPPVATAPPVEPAPPAVEQKHIHWSYSGEGAPEKWSELEPTFGTCKTGVKQTPIDFPKAVEKGKDLKALAVAYPAVPLKIFNNGHTVQANAAAPAALTVGAEKYDLVQLHAHSPSEHTVEGKSFDLELHLVHKNAAGALAVVGILFKKGKENKALAPYFTNAPKEESKEDKAIDGAKLDLAALVPARSSYYTYQGSLTTPPCSEGVTWFVVAAPAEISEAQLEKFRAATHGSTNRPVQPLGGRSVQLFK